MQVNLSTVHHVDQYARLNLRRWGYVYIRLVPDAYVHRSKFDDDGEGDTDAILTCWYDTGSRHSLTWHTFSKNEQQCPRKRVRQAALAIGCDFRIVAKILRITVWYKSSFAHRTARMLRSTPLSRAHTHAHTFTSVPYPRDLLTIM